MSIESIRQQISQYAHNRPPIVNPLAAKELSPGQRIADSVAAAVGSWPFIIVQSCILALWIAANVWLVSHLRASEAWDPYPFILLNLVLSFQAAYTGPVVMMSQNRASERDRLTAQNDYRVNQKAELEVQIIMAHLVHQDAVLERLLARLDTLTNVGDDDMAAATQELLAEHDRLLTRLKAIQDDTLAAGA